MKTLVSELDNEPKRMDKFIENTEYLLGLYNPKQQGLTSLVVGMTKMLNNIVEILSFISIHQNPLIKQTGQENIKETKNILTKIESLFEKNLKEQIEQLEINRKNIASIVKDIQNLAKKEYETLLEHQKIIVNILNENITKENLESNLEDIKILINENNKNLEEKLSLTIQEIENLNKKL